MMSSLHRNLRWLSGTTPFLLALTGIACEKAGDSAKGAGSAAPAASSPPPTASASAAPADSAAPAASAEADETIAPPTPVVSGDPSVPVNEGIVGTQPQAPDYSADTAPPAPPVEDKPPPPVPADVWVPGYYWWSTKTRHYAWVSGGWRNPPAEQPVWTAGAWAPTGGHYYWRPGFWGAKGYVPAPPAEMAPPPPRVEPQPPSPGAGYLWAPGYYAFKSKAYEWTPGAWSRPPQPGLAWVAPTYVTTGGHYYFQPGRWDHPIAQRGIAYRPEVDVHPGAHIKPVALPPAVVAEHETFVVRSSEAVVRGATRLPTGGFVLHHEPPHPEPAHPGAPPPPAAVRRP